MRVFIGNLPNKAVHDDILELVNKFDKQKPPRRAVELQPHEDRYFCVVDMAREKAARRFIKKYNGKSPFEGTLVVREYVHRSYGNERRNIHWRRSSWQGMEKRTGERRTVGTYQQQDDAWLF